MYLSSLKDNFLDSFDCIFSSKPITTVSDKKPFETGQKQKLS